MGVKTLYLSGALGAGSDLWIVPDLSQSSWTRKLDWYLNYQISRSKLYRSFELSAQLKKLILENDLDIGEHDLGLPAPLMIGSIHRLPNQQTVELPPLNPKSKWIEHAHTVWHRLGKPSLRLFLPTEIQSSEFQSLWPESAIKSDISLVPSFQDSDL